MATSQLLNSVDRVVEDSLAGLAASQPSLKLVDGHRVVVRADVQDVLDRGQVALVSGGGSGHEPSHAGLVGQGMLTAAVAGSVFASPPSSSILVAILAVAGRGGVLVIIKNYTGDRLHFGLAVERAKGMGHDVRLVIIAEDMAFDSEENTAGRRGLAGALFIHKVCGAMAEKGKSLDEIHAVALRIMASAATIGVSLSPCCLPGRGSSFQLPDGVMELGLGIHGEAGLQRTKVVSADETVVMMVDRLLRRDKFREGDHVALIVNNLGALSNLEVGIVTKAAISHLEEKRRLVVDRVACGTLMTSINMAGVSLSLLPLDDILNEGLAYNVKAPGWPSTAFEKRVVHQPFTVDTGVATSTSTAADSGASADSVEDKVFVQCLRAICDKLMAAEEQLNDLDRAAGDGDCGSTFKQGSVAIVESLDSGTLPVSQPHRALTVVAAKLEEAMGGTSGALYTLMLVRIAHILERREPSAHGLFQAARECVGGAIDVISSYGGAKRGDRTMLDALHGANDVLKDLDSAACTSLSPAELVEAFARAAAGCRSEAQATQAMRARAGRASYVSSDHWTKPDAGATAVAIWMDALVGPLRANAM